MDTDHAITLVLARSCLAALATSAATVAAGLKYDQVLITVDGVHGDDVPGLETDALTKDRRVLFEVAFSAIEDLVTHGVDEMQIQLLLAMLTDAYEIEAA